MGLVRRRKRIYVKLCLFLVLLLLSSRQASSQEYSFRSFLQDSGLVNLSINALAQDKEGFLWAGTENGLFRYDGFRFQRFGRNQGLTESYICSLHVDYQGRLWVGTFGNLYLWTGKDFEKAGTDLPIWQGQRISSLPSGEILAVVRNTLVSVSPLTISGRRSIKPFFSSEQKTILGKLSTLHTVYGAPSGDIWMACGDYICSIRQGRLSIWRESQKVPTDRWMNFLEDRHGTLWVAGSHHLLHLDKGSSTFQDRTPPRTNTKTTHLFAPLVEDFAGRILTYHNEGMARWDGRKWQIFGSSNGYIADGATALLVDREGALWSGSGGFGVLYWKDYDHWENWTTIEGLPHNSVWAVFRGPDGQLHIGTDNGPATLDVDGKHISAWKTLAGKHKGQTSSFIDDANGNIWAGTFSGELLRLDKHTGNIKIFDKLSLIYRLIRDHSGRIWICTQTGLYVINPADPNRVPVKVDAISSLTNSPVVLVGSGCVTPSGELWFASDKGVLHNSGGVWSKTAVTGFPQSILPSTVACSQDGSLYALDGTSHSLWHLAHRGSDLVAASIPLPEVLSEGSVYSVIEDRRGWLWIALDSGVAVYNGTQWRVMNQDSGLVWLDTDQNALWEDRDGSIWIGTSRGLSHLLHADSLFAPVSLRVKIMGVERNGKILEAPSGITLPWSNSQLTIHLVSTSFSNPSTQAFHYHLKGLEEEWITTTGAEVRYSTLKPGKYRFEVMATNSALQATSPVESLEFTVLPPWWLSPWIILSEIASAILVFWGVMRWHTHRLLARQCVLDALIEARTQELEKEKQELLKTREALQVLATHDSLTSLWNRRAILDCLKEELFRANRTKSNLVVALVDLDHFKHINDTHGHMAGDEVLRQAAKHLIENLRSYDHIGRYGGEEFLLILPQVGAESIAQRMNEFHEKISNFNVSFCGNRIMVTASVGYASTPDHGTTRSIEELLSFADQALYCAKGMGRNRVVSHESLREALDPAAAHTIQHSPEQ